MAKKKTTKKQPSTSDKPIKNKLSAAKALKKLKDGNARFREHQAVDYPTQEGRGEFEKCQWPYAIVLSCADSRVSPEILFNAGLNELFVIRVAGNIADTTSIASIEYAVAHLNTNLIVVLGHESCGAVGAALANAATPTDFGYNLNTLVSHITPAVAAAKKQKAFAKDEVKTTVIQNAKLTAEELKTRSSIIAKERGVEIVPAYYELITGKVDFLRDLK